MSPKLRATLASLLLCLLAASATAATVHGTVSSAVTNLRLEGKVVAAYDASGTLRGSATTDIGGSYILTLPAGSYRLLAYDPLGTYATVYYNNAESFDTSEFVDLTVDRTVNFLLPEGGRVIGVVEVGSGRLSGAVVEAYNLSGTRRGFTVTNALGEYSIVLPAGDFKLVAYDETGLYASEFYVESRTFSQATPVRVTPAATRANVSFTLETGARLSGTVLDAATQAPLPGMLVYAYTSAGVLVATTTTDANGAYRFSLAAGQYRFVAADPARVYGPVFYETGRSFEQALVVTLLAAQQRGGVNLSLQRGAVFTGHALPNVTIAAYNVDGTLHNSVTTDASGNYTLVVAPGKYKLAALDPAGTYAAQFHSGAVDFGTATQYVVLGGQTLNAIDFAPVRAGRINGTVRAASNGVPLSGMTVQAYNVLGALVAETTTATTGTYSLAVAPGQYRVLAFDARLEYATAYAGGASSFDTTFPVTVNADAAVTADLAMQRGIRVSGEVRSTFGAPIDRVDVFALDPNGNRVAAATTGANGAFTIALPAGTYTFFVSDPQHRYAARHFATPVLVQQGNVPALQFTLMTPSRRRAVRH